MLRSLRSVNCMLSPLTGCQPIINVTKKPANRTALQRTREMNALRKSRVVPLTFGIQTIIDRRTAQAGDLNQYGEANDLGYVGHDELRLRGVRIVLTHMPNYDIGKSDIEVSEV